MLARKNTRGRGQRRLLRTGSAGVALALTLGAPAAPAVVPAPVSEARAQMPDPFPQVQFGFWDIRICLMVCFPEWALCCGQEPDPLY